ncbi:MAG: sulfur oxidation c-type cytochrome SoxX [Thiotrichales bacterium]
MHIALKATAAASVLALAGMLSLTPAPAQAEEKSVVEQGKQLAFDRKKGNCLSCHVITGGNLPGNIGPALVAMKVRFPDKAKLREQIYDARIKNAHTIMPPFGPSLILSDDEIDKIAEYIYTL